MIGRKLERGLERKLERPIIGITTYHRNEAGDFLLPGGYVDAVILAGGIPVLLPPTQLDPAHILDGIDGLIFAGGGDINPDWYGGSTHPTIYLTDAERDRFELALAKAALNDAIPMLGICRGMQILNVATGGDLVVHIPETYGNHVTHRLDNPRRPIEHPVQLQPDSYLAAMMGTRTVQVVSWHHQAVKTIAPEWKQVAFAEDGLVEALEHQQYPWIVAVQWHPELSINDPAHQQLFRAWVQGVRQHV